MKKQLLRGRRLVLGLSAVMTLALSFPAMAGPADDIALSQQTEEAAVGGPSGEQTADGSGCFLTSGVLRCFLVQNYA